MAKNSEKIMAVLTAWNERVKDYEKEVDAINKDQFLSVIGRADKVKKLSDKVENERQQAINYWDNAWNTFKEDCKLKGTSSPADRTAAMQAIMAVGNSMNADILNTIIEPVKKDVPALRMLKPIIEKQGALELFQQTDAYKLLDAANKMESYAAEAEKEGSLLLNDTDPFKMEIRKKYMQDFLKAAEENQAIVKELEG